MDHNDPHLHFIAGMKASDEVVSGLLEQKEIKPYNELKKEYIRKECGCLTCLAADILEKDNDTR